MRYRNSRGKGDYRKPRNRIDISEFLPSDGVKPIKDGDILTGSKVLESKTLKGLPRSNSSITVKQDPYEITLPGSNPYALMGPRCSRAGGAYKGADNLDSGLTGQIVQSESSSFLHAFDTFLMQGKANYRYLPMGAEDNAGQRGYGYVKEMLHAIDETLSLCKGTTYTVLAINNYYIKTELPMPQGDKLVSNPDVKRSLGSAEGIYALAIHYQLYLQQVASFFNCYNKFRANQGLTIRSSWNRETPILNSLYSLLNKTAVVNSWKSLAFILNGEYFDYDWMRQMNMISSLVSRESMSIVDPIQEFVVTHTVPKFKLYVNSSSETELDPIYDSAAVEANILGSFSSMTSRNITSLSQLNEHFYRELSVTNILRYVRRGGVQSTIQEWLNFVVDTVNAITLISGTFKPAMADFRTMLDVIGRIGVNKWRKDVVLEVFDNLDVAPNDNYTVRDLYKSLMSGSTHVRWNETTARWVTYTPWNYWTGIPEYDSKNGGSFITFSTKQIDVANTAVLGKQALRYMPIFITGYVTTGGAVAAPIIAVNRLGTEADIDVTDFFAQVNRSTARLVPIQGLTDVKLRAPYSKTTLSAVDESFLQSACLKIFNVYSHDKTINVNTDLAVSPDILCFIGVEIADLQSEMITYARENGPFVVNNSGQSSIGFLGLD